jgi:hypothetical protein
MPSEAETKSWPLAGYAPGSYHCKCFKCGEIFEGDKRAVECLPCAAKSVNAALSAASAVRSEGVKVRALEWRGLKASSVFGTYEVIDATGTGKTPHFDVWANFGPDEEVYVTGGFASEDEAKSAAQTDYQNRILSAITSPVQTREDGIRIARAEIAALVPDDRDPMDDTDNQAGFRNAIDHVLQIIDAALNPSRKETI